METETQKTPAKTKDQTTNRTRTAGVTRYYANNVQEWPCESEKSLSKAWRERKSQEKVSLESQSLASESPSGASLSIYGSLLTAGVCMCVCVHCSSVVQELIIPLTQPHPAGRVAETHRRADL